MNRKQLLIEKIRIKEELLRRRKENLITHTLDKLYGWQRKFITATLDHTSCLLMAANRVGKTFTGLLIDAVHLTGEYPDWWEGHKFEKAPLCWLLGFSGEKTRDLLQTPLFGRMGDDGRFEGGLIPKSAIVDHRAMTGTSGAMREVRVKHKSGAISVCQFWSYSQGQHALMGDGVDWYHIDEEPRDASIIPQVKTRTATGGDFKNGQHLGGKGIMTFTPENGRTEVVINYMDRPAPNQYLQRATWDDAPHLTEETKENLLAEFPEWQRAMRTRGEPLRGTGLIFDFPDSEIACEPFMCPHHWYVINGMDFGWDHPQAHCQLWWDKDSDIVYLAQVWKKSKALPNEAWASTRAWSKNVPVAWPADGLQTEKRTGIRQKQGYVDEGFNMLPEHATFEDGTNSVEAGVMELYQAMKEGRFKVMRHLSDFFEEKQNYHRDEKGKIVKVGEDLLDSIRYAWMMKRHAMQVHEVIYSETEYYEEHDYSRDSRTGY